MTMGLVGFVINAGPAAPDGGHRPGRQASTWRSATSHRPADRRHDRRGGHRRGRAEPRQHRRPACRPRLTRTRSRRRRIPRLRAADRFGTPALRHGPRGLDRAAAADRAPRSRIRGSASTRSRPTTSPPSSRRSPRAGSARTSSRAANGRRPRRAGVPNERITLEGIGKTDADLRAAVRAAATARRSAGSPSSRATRRRSLAGSARRAGLASRPSAPRRPRPAQPRRHARDASPALAVGAGASKFGMTETEATGVDRLAGERRAERSGRAASISMSARSSARSTRGATPSDAAWRGRAAARDRSSLRHARCRRRLPGLPARRADPGAERFARELPDAPRALPDDRRPARLAIEPGRALVARAGWLVARVLHVRDRAVGRSSSTPA